MKINYKINIDNRNKIYYNKTNIEIFTIKEYNLYKLKYKENNFKLNDNKEEYKLLDIVNPHDKIFRKALDRKENAIQIINMFLEADDKISINEIEKYNSSYISEELRNSEADIVYKIKNKNIFFLIEHQTKIDYSMPYRILKYQLSIIESVLVDTKDKYKNKDYEYPIIIPIVLYTGKNKWNAKIDLRKTQLKWRKFKGQELSRYNILDVNEIKNDELLKQETLISKLMLIEKSKTEEEFIENLNKISKEFKEKKEVYTKEQRQFFMIAVKAIIQKQFEKDKIEKILKNLGKEMDEPMMQVIEMLKEERMKLKEESINEGRIKGKIEGKIEDIKNMLKEKLPIDLICRITGMTKEEINRIK